MNTSSHFRPCVTEVMLSEAADGSDDKSVNMHVKAIVLVVVYSGELCWLRTPVFLMSECGSETELALFFLLFCFATELRELLQLYHMYSMRKEMQALREANECNSFRKC